MPSPSAAPTPVRSLLDDLEAAFPDIREVWIEGFDRPIPMRKPSYADVLAVRKPLLRAMDEASGRGESERPLTAEEQDAENHKHGELLRRANIEMVRLCVAGGFREGDRAWSDERIGDLIDRTARPGKESPLVEAARRLAGLRESEVGGEDDPFGSPSDSHGR